MIKRPRRERKPQHRGRPQPNAKPRGANATLTFTVNGNNVEVATDLVVAVNKVPNYIVNPGALAPTGISAKTPTGFTLTYASIPATAPVIVVGELDPAVRTISGGYANPGTFPLA
ncbi:MAG TPA: hypothetical protein VNT79_02120 [Phycisphaerae bacterium]|nr:hypothetical protein [Phycisphaerae bacterium]